MSRRRSAPKASVEPDLSGFSPLLLSSFLVDAFYSLGVAASLWAGPVWRALYLPPTSVIDSEVEHAASPVRSAYNVRCSQRVMRERSTVIATHAGYLDFFVPIFDGSKLQALLVAGPVAKAPPTAAGLLDSWYGLTGTQGRLTDPAFATYVERCLGTLTLEGKRLETFGRLLGCFAALAQGGKTPEAVAGEALALQAELRPARFAEEMWEAARSMVDRRTAHIWPNKTGTLASLHMKRPPSHAIVGLLSAVREDDPLEALLRRTAFQRRAVDLAARLGNIVCGRVFDHGVTFLVDHPTSGVRARMSELAQRLGVEARRYDLLLHAGIAPASGTESLAERFRAGLAAAEGALSQSKRVVFAEARPERSASELRRLRSALANTVAEPKTSLSTRFDGYVQAVLEHSGHHFETTRAHLEAGFERLIEPVLVSGAIDQRTFEDLYAEMERAAEAAGTVNALIAPYRRLVSEVESVLERPTDARQNRGVERAIEFMKDHLSEPLTRDRVARVAGFAPGYFSRLLLRQQGQVFEGYLRRLRVTRAKQLLAATSLSIERVSQLTGFPTRSYFHRVFKAGVGMTPLEFRKREGGGTAGARRRSTR